MNAMSLGLIKGNIDELSQTTHVTWVQPRHMDLHQISVLLSQIQVWTSRYIIEIYILYFNY